MSKAKCDHRWISVKQPTRDALRIASTELGMKCKDVNSALIEAWLDEVERKDARELDFANEVWR